MAGSDENNPVVNGQSNLHGIIESKFDSFFSKFDSIFFNLSVKP